MESEMIYDLLENEITPVFYHRSSTKVPED
jgi:hypothetical protein